MAETYRIHPIALTQGQRDLSQWTQGMNLGVPSTSVSYIWYLEGEGPKILVDCGTELSAFEERGFPSERIETPESGLGRLGLKPGDIDIVILTHLHFDHVGFAYLFGNARFIVQKKELEYARRPHPWDSILYDSSNFDGLNFEVIDGDREIVPGISVFLTPGHTPGGQCVEVSTTGGKAIITGFCCVKETFVQTEDMKRKGREVAVPALHQDLREVYDSVLRVKRRADIILPLHDPAFIEETTI